MKRPLWLSLALLLILSACGSADSEPTVTEQESGSNSTPTAQTQTGSAIDVIALLDFGGRAPNEPADESEASGSPTPESTPINTPDDGATPTSPVVETTPTHEDIDAVDYPAFTPLPEIVTCGQAVDLWMESVQIWLDALAGVPVEVFEQGVPPPSGFEAFTDEMGARMTAIEDQALQLGCLNEELELVAMGRVERLVANNPAAEYVLELLQAEAAANRPEPTTTPESTEVEVAVDWTIASCAEAADVFIDRTQVLLLDALAGMTIAEIEALGEEDAPESIARFIQEFEQIRSSFLDIGCTEEDVTVLIGERIDQLAPQGEAAEELVMSLREAVADNALFEGLD